MITFLNSTPCARRTQGKALCSSCSSCRAFTNNISESFESVSERKASANTLSDSVPVNIDEIEMYNGHGKANDIK